jgi:hypothetical protein
MTFNLKLILPCITYQVIYKVLLKRLVIVKECENEEAEAESRMYTAEKSPQTSPVIKCTRCLKGNYLLFLLLDRNEPTNKLCYVKGTPSFILNIDKNMLHFSIKNLFT